MSDLDKPDTLRNTLIKALDELLSKAENLHGVVDLKLVTYKPTEDDDFEPVELEAELLEQEEKGQFEVNAFSWDGLNT